MINRVSNSFRTFFKENYLKIITAFCCIIVLQLWTLYAKFNEDENYPSYQNSNFSVFGLNIPRNLSFCGEKIPSDNYALKDNLEKEFFKNKQWKSNAGRLFQKARKWFPYIEPILKSEGVPDDFKYVAVIESHLSNARSSQGAAGFWQLVPSTARNYGLVVTDEVDDRLDVEKSTHAACKLIKDAYKIFKNWTLAAAAYNLGIGGIQHSMEHQHTDNYYDLMLNKETGSFIYRILAYKTLFSDPAHFGIKRKFLKYYPKIDVKIVKVDTAISDINHFAKAINCNPAILKLFNPWVLGNSINNPNGRKIEFKIPRKKNTDFSDYFADLLEQTKQEVTDSLNENNLAVSKNLPLKEEGSEVLHNYTEGEKLSDVAEFYHVKVIEILNWNNLSSEKEIKPGHKLIIRVSEEKKSEK